VTAPATCEAMTADGEPCRAKVAYRVDVPGTGPRWLCGIHARHVRIHGALSVFHQPRFRRWTEAEDAQLIAQEGPSVVALAEQMGRSEDAVRSRRLRLWWRAMGEPS